MRVLIFCLALLPVLASAQSYPVKPLHAIQPFPAGGPLDLMTRIYADKLTPALGQTVVVETRPGAGGAIAAESVKRGERDGYTLMYTLDIVMTVTPTLFPRVAYDPIKDFVPVGLMALSEQVLAVHPSLGVNSIAEMIAASKKASISYASGGNGSPGQLSTELFRLSTGADLLHVPYKGNLAATQSVVTGETKVFFGALPGLLGHIRAGKVRALAVTSQERVQSLPELPTMVEAGFPDLVVTSWFGVFAPAGVPPGVLDRLRREHARVAEMPDVQERLVKAGFRVGRASPDELAEMLKSDLARWARVIKAANIRVD